jgi:hypothetical protein
MPTFVILSAAKNPALDSRCKFGPAAHCHSERSGAKRRISLWVPEATAPCSEKSAPEHLA